MTGPETTVTYKAPRNVEEATARLSSAEVPGEIVEVARRLQAAGHQAVLVGGSVRDALLGLPASDWDLATSATPDEVQALFRRTIPTGIEHGTVTVLVRPPGGDGPRVPVEVTTFRGEGDYTDGRRPSSVTFHRDLVEDLARRDFTVNAFAWDPVRHVFEDPFDGLHDLQAKVIRAVGDPSERFAEDGLRTMRAVRFCATLGFSLDPATHDAIGPALGVLDKVSRERVHVELFKLLGAPRPSLGLWPMLDTGMWGHVLPELPRDQCEQAITAVDRLPADPTLRLARLLWPRARQDDAGRSIVLECTDRLRPSRQERQRIEALTSDEVAALPLADTPAAVRRIVSRLGREHLEDALALLELPADHAETIRSACRDAPLTTGELAIKGRDLIAAGLVRPGPAVGALQRDLLDRVLDDPTLNDPPALLAVARELTRETPR